ncbi:hypothetical protein KFL_004780050, partial [Klebsormidium nitens]
MVKSNRTIARQLNLRVCQAVDVSACGQY